jgi:hypothetical protein
VSGGGAEGLRRASDRLEAIAAELGDEATTDADAVELAKEAARIAAEAGSAAAEAARAVAESAESA